MIHIFALTQKGIHLAEVLQEYLGGMIHCPKRYLNSVKQESIPIEESLSLSIKKVWKQGVTLIMIMATGIVVRSIKDYIKHKTEDPAVLVMDQNGDFVIPLLSGHLGGANYIAVRIGEILQARPVITTATDVQGVLAIDEFAKCYGMSIDNIHMLKKVTGALLDGEKLPCYSTIGLHEELKPYFETIGKVSLDNQKPILCITEKLGVGDHLTLRPKNLVVGIGCRRGINCETIKGFIDDVFVENNLSTASIAQLTSVTHKEDEEGICQLASDLDVPFVVYSPEELNLIVNTIDIQESSFVKKHIGTGAVCEPSAILGSEMGRLIMPKKSRQGITLAIARYKNNMNTKRGDRNE